jgi:hypothetical protein
MRSGSRPAIVVLNDFLENERAADIAVRDRACRTSPTAITILVTPAVRVPFFTQSKAVPFW